MKCDRELAPVGVIICNLPIECQVSDEFRKAVRGVKQICTDVKLIAEGEQQLVSAVGNRVDRCFLPCADEERANLPVCLNVDELRDCVAGRAIIHCQLASESPVGISVEKNLIIFRNEC